MNPVTTSADDLKAAMSYLRNRLGPSGSESVFLVPKIPSKNTNLNKNSQSRIDDMENKRPEPDLKDSDAVRICGEAITSNSPATPGKQVSDTPSIVKVSGSNVEFLDSSAKERLSASEKERVGSVKEGVSFVKERVDAVKDGVGSSAKEGMDSSGREVFGTSGMSDNVFIASQNYHSARARKYNLGHSVHQPVRFSSIVPTHFQQGKIVKTRKRRVLTITLPPLPQITESELQSLFHSLAKIHKCEMEIDGLTVNEARLHTQRKPLSCIPHQPELSKNSNNFSVSDDNGHYHTTTASNNKNNEISPHNSVSNLIERLKSYGTDVIVTRDVSHMSNSDVDLLSLYPEIVMGSPSAHTSIAFNRY